MSLVVNTPPHMPMSIRRSWALEKNRYPTPSVTKLQQPQYVIFRKAEPFRDMGELMSSHRFWSQVDKISDGWLYQDSEGRIGARATPNGSTLETALNDALQWIERECRTLRLVVLVARSEKTSADVERRLHRLNAALQKDRWTQVRLCVITRTDLLYIRNTPMKQDVPSPWSQRKDHEPPT